MIVDAHHHLWKYDPAEYGWIGEDMAAIRRDFLPLDLKAVLRASGVEGAIAVQARQTLDETNWLLDQAEAHDFMLGVVGWIPLCDENVEEVLERLASRPKLVGVRHIVQDEPDDTYILREDFNRGVGLLLDAGLVYDVLVYERHLQHAIDFIDRHPNQRFVLDHVGKPRIRDGAMSPWKEGIREMARRENVFCKVSGMVTEARWATWDVEILRPYWDPVLEAFGPARLMFGSDWPVALLAASYERWIDVVAEFTRELSHDEQQRIWSGTAKAVYGI